MKCEMAGPDPSGNATDGCVFPGGPGKTLGKFFFFGGGGGGPADRIQTIGSGTLSIRGLPQSKKNGCPD